ncbi:MAG: hypothetical protein LBU26_06360 [Synergistaceae bacterium]|nr:hypothetical protein [Synergistaceae bacterium]
MNDDSAAANVDEYTRIDALANFNFSEKFSAGLLGYFNLGDNDDTSYYTYGGYFNFKFHPSVAFKGIYYYQSQDDNLVNVDEDSANAWKAILDINQDLLKFTSLWLEYGQRDNNFAYDNYAYDHYGGNASANEPTNTNTSKIIFVKAAQKWGETKWDSYLRYMHVDYDTTGIDDFQQIGVSIGYQWNPAVHFELLYDNLDYGNDVGNSRVDDDHVIMFRTQVAF